MINQTTTEQNKSSTQKLTQKDIDYLVDMLGDDDDDEYQGYNDGNDDVQITKHLTEKDIDYLVDMLDGQQVPMPNTQLQLNNKKTRNSVNDQINRQLNNQINGSINGSINVNINHVPQYKIKKTFIPYENLSWFDQLKYNLGFFG